MNLEIKDEVSGKVVLTLATGDSCTAIDCFSDCKKKKRAHFHLLPCKGGEQCGEKVLGQHICRHSTVTYYPVLPEGYDKYVCFNFWNQMNWDPPYNIEALQEIQLCNAYCPYPTCNLQKDKYTFCELRAWHCTEEESKCITKHKLLCFDEHKKSV
jgi:hypothetical protein